MDNEDLWILDEIKKAVPELPEMDIVKWAEEHFFPDAGISDRWRLSISPWCKPLFDWFHSAKEITNVKPVQSGGSTVGEILICWLIANSSSGDIIYNWETNDKAKIRWENRISGILKRCPPVARLIPMRNGREDNTKFKNRHAKFPHLNLKIQGVDKASNLDSDTVPNVINEEIHGWPEGRLPQARHRQTAVFRAKMINISNAGDVGGQLHEAFLSGTQQRIEWRCPVCGKWQVPHYSWRHGVKGGLRFSKEGCSYENGKLDLEKLKQTIFYECENPNCDGRVFDNPMERRKMSDSLRVSDPLNPGALAIGHRSFTYESIIMHNISWLSLINEEHQALNELRMGKTEAWARFLKHRCSVFWDRNYRPVTRKIEVATGVKKGREGITERDMRVMTVDKQAGSAARGEVPHYWCVIRDWKKDAETGNVKTQLVWEGRIGLDEDLESRRIEYGVRPICVLVDSGYKAGDVYRMCYRYGGWTAVKGTPRESFPHKLWDANSKQWIIVQKFYSPPQRVDAFLGTGREGGDAKLVTYSLQGLMTRFDSVRRAEGVEWIIPVDVSDDYKRHLDSIFEVESLDKAGRIKKEWNFRGERFDLAMCEAYQVLFAELCGFLSV